MTKVLLWDIDGTLLLTGGSGKAAFEKVFKALYNEDKVWVDIIPDGRTDDSLIDEIFKKRFDRLPSDFERAEIASLYNEFTEEEVFKAANFRLMPFVLETLNYLSKNPNIHLGLATGNFEIAARHKLNRASLTNFFKFGGYGSDSYYREELTELALKRAIHHIGAKPKEVYVIGDTIHDVRCGKHIGAKTIGVATGHTKEAELKNAGADFVIKDLSEFPKDVF